MRIGFDAKRAFANKTGLGNYNRFVLDSLYNHEKGHEFIAYTPKNNKNLFPDFPQKSVIFPKTFLTGNCQLTGDTRLLQPSFKKTGFLYFMD